MPDMDFASGLIGNFFKTAIDERHRRDTNNLDAANYLLQSGRIRDVNELLPLFGDAGKTLQKQQGKAGSPGAMLGMLANPILKAQGAGGGGATGNVLNAGGGSPQAAPPGAEGAPPPTAAPMPAAAAQGQPAPRPGVLKTDAEMRAEANAQADLASQRKINEGRAIFEPKAAATAANTQANIGGRVKVAEINAGTRGTDLHKAYNANIAAFTEKNGAPPSDEEAADIMMKTRADWQAAGRKVTDPEAFTQSWLKDAESESGGKLTPAQEKVERLKARKAWAVNGQTESPDQKLDRAKSLAKFKEGLTAFSPDDLRSLSQTATIGDTQTPYLDTSGFTGKEKAKAMTTAMAAGIVPVTAKQAEQLEAASAAAANLKGFADQIMAKLPKDASGRPIASLENKLSQYFQTDEDLASAVSWDTSVLPLLRAMQVGGRITNLEFQTALNARPKITDTLGTVQKKLNIVNAQLKNGTAPILERGAKAAAGGDGGAGGGTTPTASPAAGGGGARPAATSAAEQAKLADPARVKDPTRRSKARQILLANGKVANDQSIDQLLQKNNDALLDGALKQITAAHKPAA